MNKGKAINTVEFRTWGEFDQDTIASEVPVKEERVLNYEEKLKLYKHLNKTHPGMFSFEDINKMSLELIYEILLTKD